jgi:hypothetical protein
MGRSRARTDGVPTVVSRALVVFTRLAHTRFGGDVLLQLIYTAWFPARTAESAFDVLAGPLDGIVWRVRFAPDGIVHASDRPERYWFWPLGIPSAGAMRQWGHHATAFVGRRHFDEPFLVERYFALKAE